GSPAGSRCNADDLLDCAGVEEAAGERVPAGAMPAFCVCNQCNPTATPCAQIFPHSRASRQVQRFSISTGLLMTIEARKEVSPDCTIPRNSGGAHCELSTWPWPKYARANLITSQPAAWLSNASVSSTG